LICLNLNLGITPWIKFRRLQNIDQKSLVRLAGSAPDFRLAGRALAPFNVTTLKVMQPPH
jgi:hypothetical protein